jgi:hypothetical protein
MLIQITSFLYLCLVADDTNVVSSEARGWACSSHEPRPSSWRAELSSGRRTSPAVLAAGVVGLAIKLATVCREEDGNTQRRGDDMHNRGGDAHGVGH